MTTKYTPGPWTAEPNGGDDSRLERVYVCGPDGDMIADCHDIGLDDFGEANARLVAAAPDLLAALQRVIDEAVADDLDEWFANARAAIAKATKEH